MKTDILISGYGNIGRHMYDEFSRLNPDIYDPFMPEYSEKADRRYGFAFICVPTDGFSDGSCDTSVVESAVYIRRMGKMRNNGRIRRRNNGMG